METAAIGQVATIRVTVDTLALCETLEQSSFSEQQARAVTNAVHMAETQTALDVKSVIEQQFAAFKLFR